MAEENERLRYYDVLTNLYNLTGFINQVEDYIRNNPNKLCLLMLVDIANFSFINKSYGVEVGDKLLMSVGNILKSHFKDADVLGRVGGDEFAIFAKGVRSKEDIYLLVERVMEVLDKHRAFHVGEVEIRLAVNVGVAVYPDDGRNFKELVQNASVALRLAKEEGPNVVKSYNKEIEEKIISFVKTESLIERAIKKGLFVFHYQPYFEAKSGRIAGFEALVRILDEEGRLHYPNEFIEQLEHSHYLSEFKDWALKEVYEKIEKWGKPISINISTRTFRDESFPERLIEYARRASSEIIIEITERLYMEDPQRAEEVIQTLKKCKNIRVAIDDFGTGYSSLSYLRQISADILKVDISFVRAMLEDERSRAIVETIVRLAKALGMRTLAEGVEREEQREMLVEMGVDYLQGFLLAKPMPEDKVEELL